MQPSHVLLDLAELVFFALPPVILASSALKLRLVWHDLPFSHQTRPVQFWIELICVLAFAVSLISLHLTAATPGVKLNLMMVAVLLGVNAGQMALSWGEPAQPFKYEFASARDKSGGLLIAAIVTFGIACAAAIFAYAILLGAFR